MNKFWYWVGFPIRIFVVILCWPASLMLFPNEKEEVNENMKNIFWGRL